jgi:hypothetical protein
MRVVDAAGNTSSRKLARASRTCRIFVRGKIDQTQTACVRVNDRCQAKRFRWERAKPELQCVKRRVRLA